VSGAENLKFTKIDVIKMGSKDAGLAAKSVAVLSH
jgi:hypothetical protein